MKRSPGSSRSTVAVLVWTSLCVALGVAAVHRVRDAVVEVCAARDLSFFGFGGFAREAIDFQWLLRAPGAEARFSYLVNEGSPAAKVFGACGLYLLDSDRFDAARVRLSTDDREISMGGCIRYSKTLHELAGDLPRFCPHMKMGTLQWVTAEVGWLTGR
jgi:hypothetical protein